LKNVVAVGGQNFVLPIDLAHRLYDSLLLSHNSWYTVCPKISGPCIKHV